jgi:hypothetical protein
MGGAALNGIFSFGVAGAGVATVPVIPGLAEKFNSVFRRKEGYAADVLALQGVQMMLLGMQRSYHYPP